MERIGFIGVGTMGAPIVGHLLAHGRTVTAYARRPEALAPVVARGARPADSPAAVAAVSDIVFTMVTATTDVEQVLFAGEGIASGARSGVLVVDMSTIAPDAAREFAARLDRGQVSMLDAPVSGGPDGAKQGTLTVMAGGPAEAFQRARPHLECFASNLFHLGPNGAGQVTKACHQLLLLITAEGAAEALALAARGGVDPEQVRQVLMTGVASSRVLDRFGRRMAAREFSDGISVRLYRKDLQIVLDAARSLGASTPAGTLTMTRLRRLMEEGRGTDDLSALITVVEDEAPDDGSATLPS